MQGVTPENTNFLFVRTGRLENHIAAILIKNRPLSILLLNGNLSAKESNHFERQAKKMHSEQFDPKDVELFIIKHNEINYQRIPKALFTEQQPITQR